MILSVSRRTDIPAFYSDWFYQRIKEGFVYVRNPMNHNQVSHIPINPDVIDCIVFWTKNPQPMLTLLNELNEYNYYFQFTLTPYNQTIEKNIPEKATILNTFKRLSDIISPQRVIWRYDPILLTHDMDMTYHVRQFELLANELKNFTHTCVISFIDLYKKIEQNMKAIDMHPFTDVDIYSLAEQLSTIAASNNLKLETCAEKYDLRNYGIQKGKCIDSTLIEQIIGKTITVGKDKNQRTECGCVASIDIGEYNTCPHQCIYCYANSTNKIILNKNRMHNPLSPLLIGETGDKDVIYKQEILSFVNKNRLF